MTTSSVESYCKAVKFLQMAVRILIYKDKSIFSKKDNRLKESGDLSSFLFFDIHWNLEDDFYSYLYMLALHQNTVVSNKILEYEVFTDIEFNPKKSFNCQAYSAALFSAAFKLGIDLKSIRDKGQFIEIFPSRKPPNYQQQLF